MKRGTTPRLVAKVGVNHEYVDHIDFLFTQDCSEQCRTRINKTYPSDCVDYSNGAYHILFTESETRTFAEERLFYMDTRIVLKGGEIPETKIVTLKMNRTLFSEEVESDD